MNKKTVVTRFSLPLLAALGFAQCAHATPADVSPPYQFKNGYPTEQTVQQVYDDVDLNRAIQAYRFFYPNVSIFSAYKSNVAGGIVPNKVFALMQGTPKKTVFTANSDTPYAGGLLDLSNGPMVIELPPGPLMSVVNDLNHQWVMDLGLPGPDAGKGGKHLLLPPGYTGEVPADYFVGRPSTNHVLLAMRALPIKGDIEGANTRMKSVKIYPLVKPADWQEPQWIAFKEASDLSALSVENGLNYWKTLHELLESEPANPAYRNYYGELAALGIAKGTPFTPDERMQRILTQAAQTGNVQLRVQSLADRRADRSVWPDRKWEWAVLRPENGTFETPNYVDLQAREKWFYQAILSSPAMFRREPGAGSLYWLGARDDQGQYLDGAKTYKLNVPLPMPAKLFWSVTVYDSQTRSQIRTEQNLAALRSLEELKDLGQNGSIDLYFGPQAPQGMEKQWIKTIPGKGWFTYLRIYGPEKPAFDGSWKPADFTQVN